MLRIATGDPDHVALSDKVVPWFRASGPGSVLIVANRELSWDEAITTQRSNGTDYGVPLSGEQTPQWLEAWESAIAAFQAWRRRTGRQRLDVELKRTELQLERIPDDELNEVRADFDAAVHAGN